MSNSPRLSTIRLDSETLDAFHAYRKENDLSQSEAVRIAIKRLLKSKPTGREREGANVPKGNPSHRKD